MLVGFCVCTRKLGVEGRVLTSWRKRIQGRGYFGRKWVYVDEETFVVMVSLSRVQWYHSRFNSPTPHQTNYCLIFCRPAINLKCLSTRWDLSGSPDLVFPSFDSCQGKLGIGMKPVMSRVWWFRLRWDHMTSRGSTAQTTAVFAKWPVLLRFRIPWIHTYLDLHTSPHIGFYSTDKTRMWRGRTIVTVYLGFVV